MAHNTKNDDVSKELGARIRLHRELRGIDVSELARALGVSPSLVSMWERGKARPSLESIHAMSRREFKVHRSALLEGLPYPDKSAA